MSSSRPSHKKLLFRAKGGQFNHLIPSLHNLKWPPCHAEEIDVNIGLLRFDADFADLVDQAAPTVIDLGGQYLANILLSLNILGFLTHIIQETIEPAINVYDKP
ncbi:hypothetical protein [Candidatus Villigracilis saccharophilus]|uniref:hypothetical protein n=1 Tax=Candidatus Villigracilis saccharophilus TaxID=3140684 RepID=UPI0031352346|nr:hypothetical protein [Anaerolineales bacterium]